MKFLKRIKNFKNSLKSVSLPSLTVSHAVKRFAIFTEFLYPQFITWNRTTWKPSPTPKSVSLTAWVILSLLLPITTVALMFILIHELVVFRKDPDISSRQVLLCVWYICLSLLATVCVLTFFDRVHEFCFLMSNVQMIKDQVEEDGNKLFRKKTL